MTSASFSIRSSRNTFSKSSVLVCRLYKSADGYPSNIQKLLKQAYEEMFETKLFYSRPAYVSPELSVKNLINDSALLINKFDFYTDYHYEILDETVKITFCGKRIYVGSLIDFMDRDFKDEWVEGMPTVEE